MKPLTSFPTMRFLLFLSFALSVLKATAQDSLTSSNVQKDFAKSSFFIGTQIPVQFTAGFEQGFGSRLSVRLQAGFISKPYSGFIVDAMQAFGMNKYLARVIKKAFQSGSVFSIGPNYHFGKNYVGVYGQYLHLTGGGITPADALSIYFKKDFTQFDITGLPAFQFSMQSNIFNVGALFGHQFQLGNPHLSLNGEVGFAKIVASENTFSSNRTLIDQTSLARNLYSEIDQSIRKDYVKYGYIPTINVYLVFRFLRQ